MGGLSTWLDTFGMLESQVAVNLLQELGIGADFLRHGHWLGERFKCGGIRFVLTCLAGECALF